MEDDHQEEGRDHVDDLRRDVHIHAGALEKFRYLTQERIEMKNSEKIIVQHIWERLQNMHKTKDIELCNVK